MSELDNTQQQEYMRRQYGAAITAKEREDLQKKAPPQESAKQKSVADRIRSLFSGRANAAAEQAQK